MDASVESVPTGASCGVHGLDATFLCDRCGTFGCARCLFSRVKGRGVCSSCADKGLGEPIPWERRKEVGNVRAFWQTAKLAMLTPTRFFRTPTTHESSIAAVSHGVLTVTLGLFLSYVLLGLLMTLAGGAFAVVDHEQLGPPAMILGTYGCAILGLSPILALLAGPANALFGQVVAAAAAHGTLTLFKKRRGSFEDTLRVCSYANAPLVFSFVPVLGTVAWFWMVGVEIIGLREIHGCGTDSAAFAALAYRIALFVIFVGGYAALVIGVISMIPSTGPPP